MSKYLKLLLLAFVATIATACSLDDLSSDAPDTNTDEGVGYLKLGGVVLNVDSEDSIVGGDTIESATRNGESADGESADGETVTPTQAGDDYYIEVYGGPRHTSTSPFMAWSGTYADAKAKTNGIPLEPGNYTVYAYQTSAKEPADDISATPYYAGKADGVTIMSKQTTPINVVCRLANIKTTVELSSDLKDVFKVYSDPNDADYSKRLMTSVSLTAEGVEQPISHIFEKETTHEQPQYFRDLAPNATAGNTMTIALTGTYYTGDRVDVINGTPDETKWKDVSMVKTIPGVKAAQWRKISIGIDYNTTGNVEFVVTVQNFTYDETVTVSVTQLYSELPSVTEEEEIPDDDVNDPLAPQVTLDGQQTMTFNINSSIYDADAGAWKKYLKANITPQGESNVAELYVVLRGSTNSELQGKMDAKGFTGGRINLFPNMSAGASTYMNVAADGKKVTMKPEGMTALNKYEGTHTFRLYTKSDDNHLGFSDITIVVNPNGIGGGNGPSIKWLDSEGNDVIDEWHTLTSANAASYVIDVDVDAEAGFKELYVDIISDVLTDDELSQANLSSHLDLIAPSSDMATILQGFGFLPEGKTTLKDETYANFIVNSGLMGMLYGVHNDSKETLDDTVPCVFQITLVDNNEVKIVKSLQFNMYIPDTPSTPNE